MTGFSHDKEKHIETTKNKQIYGSKKRHSVNIRGLKPTNTLNPKGASSSFNSTTTTTISKNAFKLNDQHTKNNKRSFSTKISGSHSDEEENDHQRKSKIQRTDDSGDENTDSDPHGGFFLESHGSYHQRLEKQSEKSNTSFDDSYYLPKETEQERQQRKINTFLDFELEEPNGADDNQEALLLEHLEPLEPTVFTQLATTDYVVRDAAYYEQRVKDLTAFGRSQGYPDKLDEINLKQRTLDLIPDLIPIVRGSLSSYYEDIVQSVINKHMTLETHSSDPIVHYTRLGRSHRELSVIKAAKIQGLVSETTYYGPRGLKVVSLALADKLGDSFEQTCLDQLPLSGGGGGGGGDQDSFGDRWWLNYFGFNNYVTYVMLPEALNRLIQQDRGIDVLEARKVMRESSDYGLCMFQEIVESKHYSDSDSYSLSDDEEDDK